MPLSQLPNFESSIENINNTHSTVVIKVDKNYASVIAARLRPYRNLPRLFRPGLEEVADYVREVMIPDTFRREGPGWRPLARRTVNERVQQGFGGRHPILRRTGDLMAELTSKSHPKHIEIIKVGKNARIEIGGSSQKFMENQAGRRELRLPARPMIPGTGNIPIQQRDRARITRILQNSIKKAKTR